MFYNTYPILRISSILLLQPHSVPTTSSTTIVPSSSTHSSFISTIGLPVTFWHHHNIITCYQWHDGLSLPLVRNRCVPPPFLPCWQTRPWLDKEEGSIPKPLLCGCATVHTTTKGCPSVTMGMVTPISLPLAVILCGHGCQEWYLPQAQCIQRCPCRLYQQVLCSGSSWWEGDELLLPLATLIETSKEMVFLRWLHS